MKLTKKQLINYLIDVQGHDEDEARKITSIYGTSYLSSEELTECKAFNQ